MSSRSVAPKRSTDPTPASPARARRGSGYVAPSEWTTLPMSALVENIVRAVPLKEQRRLGLGGEDEHGRTLPVANVYCAGDLSLLSQLRVAIVGTRKVSADGAKRTRQLARDLAKAGIVVVSGLAEGVDYNAHTAAIEAGGRTIAVIGTPLEKAYPAAHARLQEQIYREHLLVSQFAAGSQVFPGNFPARNRVMALMTEATIIMEAGETSGTLHQAAACADLGRYLFIASSVMNDPKLSWPARFKGKPWVRELRHVDDIIRIFERVDER